jgi:hypothetical protein
MNAAYRCACAAYSGGRRERIMNGQIRRPQWHVASHTDALLHEAISTEIRAIAADPGAPGAALGWLLGHLLADRAGLRLGDVRERLAMGLADPAADALWWHARMGRARRPP